MSKIMSLKATRSLIFSFLFCLFTASTLPGFGASEEGGNKTDFIMHHVQDSHEWHLATIGHTHISIPLPVILFEPGEGLHVFMSSDFVDEHHNKIEVDGFYFDDHNHLKAKDETRSFYDISITKNV